MAANTKVYRNSMNTLYTLNCRRTKNLISAGLQGQFQIGIPSGSGPARTRLNLYREEIMISQYSKKKMTLWKNYTSPAGLNQES